MTTHAFLTQTGTHFSIRYIERDDGSKVRVIRYIPDYGLEYRELTDEEEEAVKGLLPSDELTVGEAVDVVRELNTAVKEIQDILPTKQDASAVSGVEYVLPETEIGTYLGKKLYRKGVQLAKISTSSNSPTTINMDVTPTRITKIEGYVATNSYGDLPINCYHSSAIRSFARPDKLTGKLIAYAGTANSGAVVFIEYTKD